MISYFVETIVGQPDAVHYIQIKIKNQLLGVEGERERARTI